MKYKVLLILLSFGIYFFLVATVRPALAVTSTFYPGDCEPQPNGDGDVDIFDYNKLLGTFNNSTDLSCDFINLGAIDIFDYNILVGNFGTSPTPTASASSPTPTGMVMSGNSQAMGKWTPRAKTAKGLTYAGFDSQGRPLMDTSGQVPVVKMAAYNGSILLDGCPSYPINITSEQQKLDYVKSIHDSHKVQGPDGKWYPTWHPPVDPTTKCRFGHEHGRDPKNSLIWQQAKEYFAYDADKNGSISTAEIAASGLPFGYVNEQLDITSGGIMMRHEDHVGHKVEYGNGEIDTAEQFFGTDNNLGVVVPVKNETSTSDSNKWINSNVRCYYLTKVHQGVSTHDAFTNNLHEVISFSDCRGQTADTASYDSKAGTAVLVGFGRVGEFLNLCDGDGDRTTIVPVPGGITTTNQNYPSGEYGSARNIIQRSCLEKHFLVPDGQFSANLYEAWPGGFTIQTPSGRAILKNGNLFDVEDANRYYYPGKPNNLGYSMELCYEVEANGDTAKGGPCSYSTDYGSVTNIAWDDPRSAFGGVHRGMYFNPPAIQNSTGPEYWYTDPFGRNAQTSPFPGSVKQQQSVKNVDYSNLGPLDPRVNDRMHNDGNNTVHAPN